MMRFDLIYRICAFQAVRVIGLGVNELGSGARGSGVSYLFLGIDEWAYTPIF